VGTYRGEQLGDIAVVKDFNRKTIVAQDTNIRKDSLKESVA